MRSAVGAEELTLDTAFNATTCGGPLINAAGELMGLVSGRFKLCLDLPFASGVQGAAVPIHAAITVLADLRAGRTLSAAVGPAKAVRQPVQLGVRVIDLAQLPAWQRQAMNWPASGLLVQEVTPGSPAARAGVQAGRRSQRVGNETLRVDGDVIVAVDGRPVRRFEDLRQTIARQAPGSTVILDVLRSGRPQRLTVTFDRPAG
ncbi:S1C family serine protease [Deinococcus hohokamensis]|uniref:S1C family serine protease n=1 Tax=Deinococcus hohokamensis TaxID=309883 RepID=A0ABV9IDV6_9DEIO